MTFQEFIDQSNRIEHDYTVTSDVYYAFQRCSNDFNPLHTDKAFAIDKGFDQCVMYGNILNAFISHFVGMLLPTRHVMIQAQGINFHRPVFMNDVLTLESKIDQVSEAVSSVVYKLRFVRKNTAGGGKPELLAKGYVQVGFLAGDEP